MNTLLYPASPVSVDERKLLPSAAFRRQAVKVVMAIFLFLLTYILLLAVAIAFAAGCCYAGIWLISQFPRLMIIILGLGLVATGISVIIFLIKFMFKVSRQVNEGRVEITEEEQPELFAFIRRLAVDTNTRFPRKIFISPEVNACVFYHSGFWSMFLPVRKNLEIGLGLVNSINISEFKAVMAHEFGHFSQRSMKLGSFTYNANRIIYNMLYDNGGYASFLQAWGNIHSYLGAMALLTVRIVEGIQWVLKQMYRLINRSYMALSREMEFHADTIAASVAGGNNLVTALSRIEIASGCYTAAIDKAGEWLREKKVAVNIFHNQLTFYRSMATLYGLPLKQGLPEISYQFIQSYSGSRINYKDQWASHPALNDRKDNLDRAAMDAVPDDTSAWVLFRQAEVLQEMLTAGLYRNVKLEEDLQKYDPRDFEKWYTQREQLKLLPAAYRGFYDGRLLNPHLINLDEINAGAIPAFDTLFNEENGQREAIIRGNRKDIVLVKMLQQKDNDIKSFDFDGVKYAKEDAAIVCTRLEEEIAVLTARRDEQDQQAYQLFYSLAAPHGDAVREAYGAYTRAYDKYAQHLELIARIDAVLRDFFNGMPSVEAVVAAVATLTQQDQPALKKFITGLLEDDAITLTAAPELYRAATAFLESDLVYFYDNNWRDDELNILYNLNVQLAEICLEQQFNAYKQLLEIQLALYQPVTAS